MRYTEVLSFFLGSLLTLILWLNWSYFEDKACLDSAELTYLNEIARDDVETQLALQIADITRRLSLMRQERLLHEEDNAKLPHEIIKLRTELSAFQRRILDKLEDKSHDSEVNKTNDQECCEMNLTTSKCAARFNHTLLGDSGMSGKVCGSFKFLLNWSMRNFTRGPNKYKIIDVVKNCTHTHTELVFNETKGFYQVQDGYYLDLNHPNAECEYFPRHL